MDSIFTVTSIFTKTNESNKLEKLDSRCFGFFSKLDDALQAVEENRCDMHECYYDYLVIEEFKSGIHPVGEEVQWFEWYENGWQSCYKPEEISNVFNYAIG